MTSIIGKAEATAEQMAAYLLSMNPDPKINMDVTSFCRLFLYVAAIEGVRGDALFAQSCKETGNFKFGGTVKPEQNNYAGIGTVNADTLGAFFPDEATGILAQAQHAKAYATANPLNYECVDPRYHLVTKGKSPNWEGLGGSWAVAGYDTKKYSSLDEANAAHDSYGYQIINILNAILGKTEEKDDVKMSNSPLVDYVKISPNSNNPRKNTIKKITIHHMAGNLSVETCGNIFANKDRQASSNYGIGSDGRVGMYVEEANRSWCSSNADNDHQAITIEVADCTLAPDWMVSEAAFNKLIDLCVDICQRNGIKQLNWTGDKTGNLTCHYMFAATACPEKYLKSRMPDIANLVNARLGVVDQPQENSGSAFPYLVQITADTLNVRAGAGTSYKVTTTVKKNQVYTIVGESNGWGKLKSGAGWIYLAYTKKK